MLKQDYLLVYGFGKVIEVVLAYNLLIFCGSLCSSLTINIVEMEKVRVCYYLSRVIKQYTVRSIAQLVAKTIFWRKIDELLDQFSLWLLGAFRRKKFWPENRCTCNLNFCKFSRGRGFFVNFLDVRISWRCFKRLKACFCIVLDPVGQKLDLLGRGISAIWHLELSCLLYGWTYTNAHRHAVLLLESPLLLLYRSLL